MALPLLSNCTSIAIQDHEVCGSLGPQGAACYHLLTNDSRTLSLTQFAQYWDDMTDPKVATSISTITDWKGDIEQLCSAQQGICSVTLQAQATALVSKMNAAIAAAKKGKANASK
jgi:hypothetical protein